MIIIDMLYTTSAKSATFWLSTVFETAADVADAWPQFAGFFGNLSLSAPFTKGSHEEMCSAQSESLDPSPAH